MRFLGIIGVKFDVMDYYWDMIHSAGTSEER
jgi:hypothetical protein